MTFNVNEYGLVSIPFMGEIDGEYLPGEFTLEEIETMFTSMSYEEARNYCVENNMTRWVKALDHLFGELPQ